MDPRVETTASPRTVAPRSNRVTSEVLVVSPWWDPELALSAHDPLGTYVEDHWLPVLGPSALLALRWLTRALAENPPGLEIPMRDFARSLGLGRRTGRDAPASRCLGRLCYFGLARPDRPAASMRAANTRAVAVRTHVPSLPAHLHRRLPAALRSSASP